MKLDHCLRDRLSRLGASESAALSAEARARIARNLAEAAPGIIRRARVQRAVARAAAAGIAGAALVVLVGVVVRPRPDDGRPVPRGTAAVLPCASYGSPGGDRLQFRDGGDGARTLDLGKLALLRTSADSEIEIATATPCRTELRLTRGEVHVHARQLGGGELIVSTPTVQVAVRGTLFAVQAEPRRATVEVVEGSVEVRPARLQPLHLSRGQRVSVDGRRPQVGELSADRARAIRANLVAPPPRVSPPPAAPSRPTAPPLPRPRSPERPPSDDEQLDAADFLFQAGDLPGARRLFGRVGAGSGGNAEAAWVRLARLELNAGNFDEARLALAGRQRRFGRGLLAAEALWVAHEVERQTGNLQAARQLADQLTREHPRSPYAGRARLWLRGAP